VYLLLGCTALKYSFAFVSIRAIHYFEVLRKLFKLISQRFPVGVAWWPWMVETVTALFYPDLGGEPRQGDPAPPLTIWSRVSLGAETTPSAGGGATPGLACWLAGLLLTGWLLDCLLFQVHFGFHSLVRRVFWLLRSNQLFVRVIRLLLRSGRTLFR